MASECVFGANLGQFRFPKPFKMAPGGCLGAFLGHPGGALGGSQGSLEVFGRFWDGSGSRSSPHGRPAGSWAPKKELGNCVLAFSSRSGARLPVGFGVQILNR